MYNTQKVPFGSQIEGGHGYVNCTHTVCTYVGNDSTPH
jgi:hypothetical protein